MAAAGARCGRWASWPVGRLRRCAVWCSSPSCGAAVIWCCATESTSSDSARRTGMTTSTSLSSRPATAMTSCARCTSTCSPSRPTRRAVWHRRDRRGPVRRSGHRVVLGALGDVVPQRVGRVALENDLPDYRLPRPARTVVADTGRGDRRRGRETQTARAVWWRQGQPRHHAPAGAGGYRLRHVRLLPFHLRAGRASTSAWSTPWWRTAGRGGCTGRGSSMMRWTRRSRRPTRSSGSAGSSPQRRSARTGPPCPSPSSTASPRSPSGSPGAPTSTTSCGTRPARRSTTCGG